LVLFRKSANSASLSGLGITAIADFACFIDELPALHACEWFCKWQNGGMVISLLSPTIGLSDFGKEGEIALLAHFIEITVH